LLLLRKLPAIVDPDVAVGSNDHANIIQDLLEDVFEHKAYHVRAHSPDVVVIDPEAEAVEELAKHGGPGVQLDLSGVLVYGLNLGHDEVAFAEVRADVEVVLLVDSALNAALTIDCG